MRKFVLLFLFLILSGICMKANDVSVHQAQRVALNFYFEKYNQYEGQVDLKKLKIQSTYTETDGEKNLYYVFQINKGGFVLVAADNRLKPVLGYSFENDFVTENPPPNVQYWLRQYKDQVIYARKNKIEPDKNILEEWAYFLNNDFTKAKTKTKSKSVDPLLTTRWNQDFPYNLYCPFDSASGSYTTTGCQATAMAQIAYYWRWPDHGQGYTAYVPASHPEYGLQTADYENTWYRYNEMIDSLETANSAVAEYIYHFSAAFHTDFSTGASFMDSIFILNHQLACDSIAYHFKFDSLQVHYRDSMPIADWKNLLMGMLDTKCPIFYAGYRQYPTIGHFFVCDGYQDEEYYHFNFGWGGTSDGYYHIDTVLNYNSNQLCMSAIYPDTAQFNYPLYASGADTLMTLEGSISDGSGPVNNYLNNTNATWLIDPQTEYDSVTDITIVVKQLDIFEDGDKLTFYDGEDNSAPIIAELSGNILPDDIESTGNKVFIEFTTNGVNTASGFYLNYKCDQPIWCSNMTLTDSVATFDDGSGSFYYNNSSGCLWTIDPGLADPLTLHFNYFNSEAENDILKVFDYDSQELLAEISGYYEIPPEPITAPSGKMMLMFLTNQSIQAQGWEVWYDINVGITTNAKDFDFQIMPNPITNDFQINFTIRSKQQVVIRLFNSMGQKQECLLSEHREPGAHTFHGHLNHYPRGIYFCQLQVGNETVIKKIIKL